ncbi:MAG: PadR family transcriptional regulator [Candidatus Hodarchaeales archaeon]|jgi:DNA-binding PadR family transcriptional regulator
MSSDNQEKTKNSKTSSILMGKVKKKQLSFEPLPVTKILFLALLKKYPNSSGYDLMQRVKEFSDNLIEIQSGSIYPTLRDLEKLDLVTSEQQPKGRKRRLYTLTESGKRELTVLGTLLRTRMRLLMSPLLELIENG